MDKMYIAVLDEFPDYMVPTLVAHSVLGAHLEFTKTDPSNPIVFGVTHYEDWLENSFKKCVIRVNQKEFDKIAALPNVYIGYEKKTLDGKPSCVVVCPIPNEELPNVLKFARLWKPKENVWIKEILSAVDAGDEERLAWAISMTRNEMY